MCKIVFTEGLSVDVTVIALSRVVPRRQRFLGEYVVGAH